MFEHTGPHVFHAWAGFIARINLISECWTLFDKNIHVVGYLETTIK